MRKLNIIISCEDGGQSLKLAECQWEEVLDGLHDVGLFLAIHDDLHVLMVALLEFHDGLSANAAWGDWMRSETCFIPGSNGNGVDCLLGILRLRCKDG